MNEQQELIATMAIGLILLVIWGVYKPYLKNILFNTPPNTPTLGSYVGSLPGQIGGGVAKASVKGAADFLNPITYIKNDANALNPGNW